MNKTSATFYDGEHEMELYIADNDIVLSISEFPEISMRIKLDVDDVHVLIDELEKLIKEIKPEGK